MSSAPRRIALDEIRGAIHAAAKRANSYRHVARAIGISPQGLSNFLDGAEPRSGMRRRLTDWYLVEVSSPDDAATTGLALAALDVLGRHLADVRQRILTNTILADVEEQTRAAGVPPPVWLADLRASEKREGERG